MKTIVAVSVGVIINCSFADQEELYKAYMPFVCGGGLFLETAQKFSLGDELELQILFNNDPNLYKIESKVIWITPINARNYKISGIGVQFLNKIAFDKIEMLLADMVFANAVTATM